eukprot:225121-Alexandrium_andersonii.AAC.1
MGGRAGAAWVCPARSTAHSQLPESEREPAVGPLSFSCRARGGCPAHRGCTRPGGAPPACPTGVGQGRSASG